MKKNLLFVLAIFPALVFSQYAEMDSLKINNDLRVEDSTFVKTNITIGAQHIPFRDPDSEATLLIGSPQYELSSITAHSSYGVPRFIFETTKQGSPVDSSSVVGIYRADSYNGVDGYETVASIRYRTAAVVKKDTASGLVEVITYDKNGEPKFNVFTPDGYLAVNTEQNTIPTSVFQAASNDSVAWFLEEENGRGRITMVTENDGAFANVIRSIKRDPSGTNKKNEEILGLEGWSQNNGAEQYATFIRFHTGDSIGDYIETNIQIGISTPDALAQERIRIDRNGTSIKENATIEKSLFVGEQAAVGTSEPTATLSVLGTDVISDFTRVIDGTAGAAVRMVKKRGTIGNEAPVISGDIAGGAQWWVAGKDTTIDIIGSINGFVETVSESPDGNFDVSGGIDFETTNVNKVKETRMRITSDGRVGINNDDPEKLLAIKDLTNNSGEAQIYMTGHGDGTQNKGVAGIINKNAYNDDIFYFQLYNGQINSTDSSTGVIGAYDNRTDDYIEPMRVMIPDHNVILSGRNLMNVGVGKSPSEKLDVNGNVAAAEFLGAMDWNNIYNAPAFITTETDPVWTADKSNYYTSTQVNNLPVSTFTNDVPYLTTLLWQQSGDDIYYDDGNVGINTNTPVKELEVNGKMAVGNSVTENKIELGSFPAGGRTVSIIDSIGAIRVWRTGGANYDPIIEFITNKGDEVYNINDADSVRRWDIGSGSIDAGSVNPAFFIRDRSGSSKIRMAFDSLGNVGVGVNEMDERFQVDGNIKADTGYLKLAWSWIYDAPSFITTETDPVWAAEKSNYYTSTQVNNLPVSTFTNDVPYLTSYTETDPVWTADKPQYLTALQVQALPVSTFTNDVPYLTTYENNYVNAGSFNTVTGELTLTGEGLAGATVDLDGRYLTAYSETDPIYTADKPSILFWSDTLTDIATSYDLSQITDTKVTAISFSGATLQLQQTGLPSLTTDIDTSLTIATKFDLTQVSGGSKWGYTALGAIPSVLTPINTSVPVYASSQLYVSGGLLTNNITGHNGTGGTNVPLELNPASQQDVTVGYFSGTPFPTLKANFKVNGNILGDSIKETTKISYNSLYGVPSSTSYWTASGDDIYNNNAGNVGINISSPNAPLHIFNTNNATIRTGTSGGRQLSFGSIDGGFYTHIGTLSNHTFNFIANNARVGKFAQNGGLVIGKGYSVSIPGSSAEANGLIVEGAVGIATTSPTTGYKLDVNGDAYVQGISAATQAHESDTIRSLSNNTALIIEGNGTGVVRIEDPLTTTGAATFEGSVTAKGALISKNRRGVNYRIITGDIGTTADYPASDDDYIIFDKLTYSRIADINNGSIDGQILTLINKDDTHSVGFNGNIDSGTYNLPAGYTAEVIWNHANTKWIITKKAVN